MLVTKLSMSNFLVQINSFKMNNLKLIARLDINRLD